MQGVTEKELMALYRARLRDYQQSQTRRRRRINSDPEPFANLLGQYFQSSPGALSRIEETRACMAWPTFVGESAARVSEACRVRGETLIVTVSDPLWMAQLSWLKHDLLRKYRTEFPRLGLKDIYFTRYDRR